MLFVVHNVTSSTRLLDVVPLFRGDFRVQMLFTCTGSSPFQYGVERLMEDAGLTVLPWEQALATPVDLAVSASFGGRLDELTGHLTILSHGVGYNKRLASPDRPAAGSPVFGLAPEWVLRADGAPVADTMVLSHPEQLDRLREACPRAVPTAVVAGDPCFDRMLAAVPHRERFRRALDVRRGQRLVVVTSTWNPQSLAGDAGADVLPGLLERLTGELPADEYRLAVVLHPNIWNGHGPGQVRWWLDRARRAGLTAVDPLGGWRQALIAADLVVGDFGSVTYYAAALGVPVLLGAAAQDVLGETSPVADFVRRAPRLDPFGPLAGQFDRAVAGHRPLPGPAALTTSVPGRSAALLREGFYRALGVPEPPGPAFLDPLPLPPYEPPVREAPMRVLTRIGAGAVVEVARFAGPSFEPDGEGAAHTVAHEDGLDRGQLDAADIVHRSGGPDDVRLGSPPEWAAEVLRRHPGAAMAVYVTGPGTCVARTREGEVLSIAGGPGAADPVTFASAAFARLAAGLPLTGELTVRTGAVTHRAAVTRCPG